MRLRHPVLFAALILSALAAACETGSRVVQTTTASAPLENAVSADVRIRPGAGEVTVRGSDIDTLMNGTFRFNRRHWEPRVDFLKVGDRSRLVVERRRSRTLFLGTVRNTWDIALTNRIPLDLDFDFGAGEARLDLRGLKLNSLTIDMGVGDLTLDLSGPRAESLEASIDGGIGHATIFLPSEIGVRLRIDGGLGSINAPGFIKSERYFTNEAYGKTPTTIDLEVDAGIGSIDLRLRGAKSAEF
ncbi:MAG: hypothetical protein FJY80_03940 [Candidatus Aminicenantes bacterium]|nr:hypothetical protein [Candidatus Aminicenantes bacterium]